MTAPAELIFIVPGRAAPQGSKRHVGGGVMVESSKRVKPWRADVREAAMVAMRHAGLTLPMPGPFSLVAEFVVARPKGHLTSRGALSATGRRTPYPMGGGDVDKLCRALCDALSGIVYHDDRQVVRIEAAKSYGEHDHTVIGLYDLTPVDDPVWGAVRVAA